MPFAREHASNVSSTTREQGWHRTTRWVERRALEEFPNVNFSDPRVKWADMSGDGLQDIVLVHDGSVDYWPNLGYGNWGRRRHMRNSPRLPYGYDPRRILLGDVDGDGLADLIYVDHTRVTLWINQSGNGWSDPIVIQGTPAVSDMDSSAPGRYARHRRQRAALESRMPAGPGVTRCTSWISPVASSPTCSVRWTTTWVPYESGVRALHPVLPGRPAASDDALADAAAVPGAGGGACGGHRRSSPEAS